MARKLKSKNCSMCGKDKGAEGRDGQAYCRSCHAKYMREHRPRHSELPPHARLKAIARAYANTYLRRGKIERKDCNDCGHTRSQMHHEDYTKPTEVIWLCRPCHLKRHEGGGTLS